MRVASKLMQFWLKVFPLPELSVGFNRLITFMNRFPGAIPVIEDGADFHLDSALSDKRAIYPTYSLA
jgi:hypothetical protein